MAGIIGTNISDNILTKRCKGFICFDDLSFTSAVVDGSFPVIFSNSANTLLTVPEPIII